MEASDEKLKELQTNTGVDFIGLRKKYGVVRAQQPETVFNVTGDGMSTISQANSKPPPAAALLNVGANPKAETEQRAKEAFEALNDYYVCKTCQGMGLVKEVYNHMVMERNCPECDGESIIRRVKVSELKAQNDRAEAEVEELAKARALELEQELEQEQPGQAEEVAAGTQS